MQYFKRRAPVHPVPVFVFERFADRSPNAVTTKQPRRVVKRRNSTRGDLYLESVAHLILQEDLARSTQTKKTKKKKKKKPSKKTNDRALNISKDYRPMRSTSFNHFTLSTFNYVQKNVHSYCSLEKIARKSTLENHNARIQTQSGRKLKHQQVQARCHRIKTAMTVHFHLYFRFVPCQTLRRRT